jgi:hypothetical protein
MCATINEGQLKIETGAKLPEWVMSFLREAFPQENKLLTQLSLMENPALPSSTLSTALKKASREKCDEDDLEP